MLIHFRIASNCISLKKNKKILLLWSWLWTCDFYHLCPTTHMTSLAFNPNKISLKHFIHIYWLKLYNLIFIKSDKYLVEMFHFLFVHISLNQSNTWYKIQWYKINCSWYKIQWYLIQVMNSVFVHKCVFMWMCMSMCLCMYKRVGCACVCACASINNSIN